MSFIECGKITDGTARLACFDAAAADFTRAVQTKEIRIVDREEIRKAKRSLFGFTSLSLPFFGNDGEPADRQIDTSVKAVRELGYDKYELRLEDGALWQTTEPTFSVAPRAGDRILIKRGALGGYFLSFNGSRMIRGRRVG